MTLNPQDALTAHEREQTCKVIDRLNDEAETLRHKSLRFLAEIIAINHQMEALHQQKLDLVGKAHAVTDEEANARHAAEMLCAELEGEGDPRWRSSSPEAANAEAQARAEVEKQEAQARGRVKIMEVR